MTRAQDGEEKSPKVYFKAEDKQEDSVEPRAPGEKKDTTPEDMYDEEADEQELESTKLGEETVKTGILRHKPDEKPGPMVESRSGASSPSFDNSGDNAESESIHKKLIRWSPKNLQWRSRVLITRF